MKDVFIVQVENGGMKFNSDYHKAMFKDFLKDNHGVKLRIIPQFQISDNMRRYFEGGIVPFFALQHFVVDADNGQWCVMPQKEARNTLKLEFNPTYFRDISGKVIRQAESTASLGKKNFTAFIERCLNYFEQNGYEMPDPEEYKNWRDHAPDIGEEYPPILRLRELAYKKLLELNGYEPTEPLSPADTD